MVHDSTGSRLVLNAEKQDRICRALKLGCSFKWACVGAGVHDRTGHKWLQQGELDHSMGAETVYADFYTAVKEAESDLEARLVSKWTEALEKKEDGWKGIMAFLEKRFKEDWGKAPVDIHASVLDLRKSPEFTQLVAMISNMLPPEKQVELSELLAGEKHED